MTRGPNRRVQRIRSVFHRMVWLETHDGRQDGLYPCLFKSGGVLTLESGFGRGYYSGAVKSGDEADVCCCDRLPPICGRSMKSATKSAVLPGTRDSTFGDVEEDEYQARKSTGCALSGFLLVARPQSVAIPSRQCMGCGHRPLSPPLRVLECSCAPGCLPACLSPPLLNPSLKLPLSQ